MSCCTDAICVWAFVFVVEGERVHSKETDTTTCVNSMLLRACDGRAHGMCCKGVKSAWRVAWRGCVVHCDSGRLCWPCVSVFVVVTQLPLLLAQCATQKFIEHA